MNWITENWEIVGQIALQVVGAAALIATLTPSETDNKIIGLISKLIHTLGGNFGKAKNGTKAQGSK